MHLESDYENKMIKVRYASVRHATDEKLLVLETFRFFDKLYCSSNNCFIANVIVNIAAMH